MDKDDAEPLNSSPTHALPIEEPSSKVSSHLLDLVRSVGIGRGTEVTLDVLFLRWKVLTDDYGPRAWKLLMRAIDGGEPAVQAVAFTVGQAIPDDHSSPEYGSGVSNEFMRQVLSLASEVGSEQVEDPVALVRDAFEIVLDGARRLGKEAGTRETPTAIANLLSRLAVADRAAVLDPACGVGNALLEAAAWAGALEGIEINSVTARHAWMRLQMSGHPGNVWNADAFSTAGSMLGRFSSVVLHPPWGDVARERDLRFIWAALPQTEGLSVKGPQAESFLWVLLSIALLDKGGRAAVIVPNATAFPRHRAWHEYLVGQGALEAIVSLPPGGLFADTSIATSIWLLRPPSTFAKLAPLLFLDAESLVRVAGHRGHILDAHAVDQLCSVVEQWREGDGVSAPAHVARALPRHEVDLNLGLLPKQYLARTPVEAVVHPEPPKRLISALRIENLKSFESQVEVQLTPLTLIYGANSAGKSSILQSLLLLKQSLRHPTLVTQGESTDLGSFAGIVHKHQDVPIRLGIEYGTLGSWIADTGVPDPASMRSVAFDFVRSGSGLGVLAHESIAFGSYLIPLSPTNAGDLDAFRVDVEDVDSIFQGLATGVLLYPFDSRQKLDGGEADAERRLKSRQNNARRGIRRLRAAGANGLVVTRDGLLPSGIVELPHVVASSHDEREDNVIRSYMNRLGRLLAGVATEFRCLLDSVVYLGPLRSAPQRFYDRTATSSRSGDGRQTAMFLFDNNAVVGEVNAWFENLGIPYSLDVVSVGALGATRLVGDLVALQLTDSRTHVEVTPSDVGFGVSQVLPIAVELLSRRESVICIEQPETHLHPRLQSRLADLFIHSTNAAGRGNQVIVETHSEHVMLRIQRRVREGLLTAEEVSVLYVDQDATGHTEVKRLRLDEEGNFLDEWPHGFFDERLAELFGEK